jgi:DNA (cytosine-5)-methyltransferase 1
MALSGRIRQARYQARLRGIGVHLTLSKEVRDRLHELKAELGLRTLSQVLEHLVLVGHDSVSTDSDSSKHINAVPRPTFIDLFSGAGGFSKGLVDAGFKPLMALEQNAVAAKVYKKHFPNVPVYVDDITRIGLDPVQIMKSLNLEPGQVSVLIGSPPCQEYSIRNPNRSSVNDPRNSLFQDYFRFVSAFLPRAFLIENVPGLLTKDFKPIVDNIYEVAERLGYTLDHRILYGPDFGLPQARRRAFFIGTREHQNIIFPEPQTGTQVTVWDAISDLAEPYVYPGEVNKRLEYEIPPQSIYQRLMRENSTHMYNHHTIKLGRTRLRRIQHIPPNGNWLDIPKHLLPKKLKKANRGRNAHTKWYGRLSKDGLAGTILTEVNPSGGAFIHPEYDRMFTVLECARLQGFPDTFIRFMGGSIRDQYRMIGNAVPPILAKVLGESLLEMLEPRHRNHDKNPMVHTVSTNAPTV